MTDIDAARYGRLLHAYGFAADTPGHLAALADGDADARKAAQSHLWSAVIHQGTPWTVTPDVALVVASLIEDPRLAGTENAALRANLLTFLAAVAEGGRAHADLDELAPPEGFDADAALAAIDDVDDIFGDEVLGNYVYAKAIRGCRAVTPGILAAATGALSDPEPAVRAAAAYAIGSCHPDKRDARHLDDIATRAAPDERAAIVLAMGEIGEAPRAYLDDPHPGVRACAALAPALAGDPAATDEILAALADPVATESWFARRPPQFPMHIRFALVTAAIERVGDPERLLPAALAIAPIASASTVSFDWGPLLMALRERPEARRRYLAALVANDDLWDPRNGTVGLALRDAGLPRDRDACRALTA